MVKPVIYVFINKSLHMSSGKVGAQVGHAVAMSIIEGPKVSAKIWNEADHRYMIILEAKDDDHMTRIQQYLFERGLYTTEIFDEGSNEVEPVSLTAMATNILIREDRIKEIFGIFKLYRDTVKVTVEVEK